MDDPTVTAFNNTDAPSTTQGAALAHWGPFQIIQKVGQGGFGEVYHAFDTTLQREVALKILRPRGLDAASEESEVLREARQMAKVRHTNVLTVHGVDKHDGRVGFWSDYVHGKTLSALLAINGPMSARETAHIGIDLAKAIGAVHAAGLLHRDIKASNVMREEGGRILLMDFGLTHEISGAQIWSGTPAYMAPELMAGSPATVSTDIYALGVLLFHLLTNKYPYAGDSWEQVKAAQESTARLRLLDARPDLPEAFATVVEKAVAAAPANRYLSTGELIAALAESMGPLSTHSFTIPTPQPRPEPLATKPGGWFRAWMMIPIAVVLALGVYLAPPLHKMLPASSGANAQYLEAHDLLDHYYRSGNTPKAIALLERYAAEYPNNASAFADLARANYLEYRSLRDPKYVDPLIQAADKALAIEPKITSVHVTLALLYIELGKFDRATQEADEALKLDPLNPEAHWAQGELLFVKGKTAEAGPEFVRATELAPDDWRFQNMLAYYYQRIGNQDKELAASREAARLSPDNPRALAWLGNIELGKGNLKEAEAAYRKALSLDDRDSFNFYLGQVLIRERKFDEAVPLLQKATSQNPNNYFAWGALGIAYRLMPGSEIQSKEAFSKAIQVEETARTQKPKDPLLLSELGADYAARGNEEKALPILKQALLLAPDDPEVLFVNGLAFEYLHHRNEALQWMQKALEKGYPLSAVEARPQLDSLRADPRFVVVRKQFEKRQ